MQLGSVGQVVDFEFLNTPNTSSSDTESKCLKSFVHLDPRFLSIVSKLSKVLQMVIILSTKDELNPFVSDSSLMFGGMKLILVLPIIRKSLNI